MATPYRVCMGRSNLLRWLVVVGLVAALVYLPRQLRGGSGGPPPAPGATLAPRLPIPPEAVAATVQRPVDGDTIWVRFGAGDQVEKVRILEIDAPELNVETGEPECGAVEAAAFAAQELPVGSTVHLLPDREDKDRYGRLLRYVWDAGGEFYQEKAVSLGYVRTLLVRPNDRYIAQLRAVEAVARRERLGIWGSCPV